MSERSTTIGIVGMSCGQCADTVKNLIGEMDGVKSAEVDLNADEANVLFEDTGTTAQTIIERINRSSTYKAEQK